jgi:hypothetical protein
VTDDRYQEWDSAYVLGALPADERREYEAHLAGCPSCAAAVADLAGLPGVLNRLPLEDALAIRDQPDPVGTVVRDGRQVRVLADRARRRRRQGRLRAAAAGVAVAAVLAGGGVAVGTQLGDDPAGTTAAATAEPRTLDLRPVGGTGLSAQLTVTPTRWGTRFDWHCSYPTGSGPGYPRAYALVVTAADGTQTTVATWESSGTSSSGLAAAADLTTGSIRSVDIRPRGSDTPLARGTF